MAGGNKIIEFENGSLGLRPFQAERKVLLTFRSALCGLRPDRMDRVMVREKKYDEGIILFILLLL